MNTKSFELGFTTVNAIFDGISTTKRGIVRATKTTAQSVGSAVKATKDGVLNTSETVTSFFAGAKQAVAYRSGKCRKLTVEE